MTLTRPADGPDCDTRQSSDPFARLLALRRPIVMGVLNVTPDSFSDGGRFLDPATAIGQARRIENCPVWTNQGLAGLPAWR